MTLEERNSFSNLILLCDLHHGKVDKKANEGQYPVDLLVTWKVEAEKDIRSKIDGLDRLTEERLEQMLTLAARDIKREIGSAIDKLSQVSRGAAEILRALFAQLERSYLDPDAVATLDSASYRLGHLQDGATTLYSASVQLGNIENGASKLLEAAYLLGGLNDASARLEEFALEYSRMLHQTPAMPRVPDIAGQIEDACDVVLSRIDRKVASIDFGDPPIIVNDEQRWKYALWGFFAGVMAVMITVAILAYSGKV